MPAYITVFKTYTAYVLIMIFISPKALLQQSVARSAEIKVFLTCSNFTKQIYNE